MKRFFPIAAMIAFAGAVNANQDFTWSEADHSKILFGARTTQIDVWGKNILVVQCAIKNQSDFPVAIPVLFTDMNIHPRSTEYKLMVFRSGDDPFVDSRDHSIRIQSQGVEPDPFAPVEHIEPERFVILNAGEVFEFSPVTTDLSNDPRITWFSLALEIKLDGPNPRTEVRKIRVVRIPGKHLSEDVFTDLEAGQVASGVWRLKLRHESVHHNAEQKSATGQPATRPESMSEGGAKPQPASEGRSR